MSFLRRFIEKYLQPAIADISAAARQSHLIRTLAGQDIASIYKRSRIGAFWITIAMAITIASVGLVFGELFNSTVKDFLPYFTAGTILWGFISSALNQGCGSFLSGSGIILQVRIPLFTHVMRVLYKELVVLAHNAVIFPVVFLVFMRPLSPTMLLAIPGLLLLVVNLSWMMLILAVICTRFRDMAQIVQSGLGVLMFITPILWKPEQLRPGSAELILGLNPLFHFIHLVRAPLLGEMPAMQSWWVSSGLAIAGWAVAVPFFGRFRNRIAYWL